MEDLKKREDLVETLLQMLANYDDDLALAALTEASSLLAGSVQMAIHVEIPLTMEQAIERYMARAGCDEKQARVVVESIVEFDRAHPDPSLKPKRPKLRLVRSDEEGS